MIIDLWIIEGLIRMKNLVSLIMHNYRNIHVSPVTKQRVALTRSHPNQNRMINNQTKGRLDMFSWILIVKG